MTSKTFSLGGLGYVGVFAQDPSPWFDFGTQVCGLAPALIPPGPRTNGIPMPISPTLGTSGEGRSADGSVFFKMDERQWRLAVHPGKADGLAYLGFEVSSELEFARAMDAIASKGVAIREGSPGEREARGVAALAVFEDPAGHRLEIFATPILDQPFRSAVDADLDFVTGDLGMGHVVLYVPSIKTSLDFYRDVLGFERTDFMNFGPDGMGIHFLRCTRRHHSLALLQVGDLSGLQHLMIEATSLDGVGKALDRAQSAGVPITSTLGRHRNDKTVSFYMRGPSAFDVEIGWDSLLVDEGWVEHEFAGGGDDWGHAGLDADSLKPES